MEQQKRTKRRRAAVAFGLILIRNKEKLMNRADTQNLPLGLIAGIAAAVIGAMIWALITVATNYQIGWMAVGVGFLVGYAIRYFGKGSDPIFSVSGSIIALLGCIAGNILTVVILVGNQEQVGVISLLSRLTPGIVVDLLKETFQPMDILFYGIAVYEAYKFSVMPAAEAPAAAQPAK